MKTKVQPYTFGDKMAPYYTTNRARGSMLGPLEMSGVVAFSIVNECKDVCVILIALNKLNVDYKDSSSMIIFIEK